MTEVYLPFSSGPGANVSDGLSGPTWSQMARYFLGNGVIPFPIGTPTFHADPLATYADSSGMQVKVRSGALWAMGHYYHSDAEQTLAIAASNATNPRIDRVVARLSWTARTIVLAVLTGTPAASPTPPALTQSSTVWEIPLAQVRVNAAVVTITSTQTTDERQWSAVDTPVVAKTDPLTAAQSSIDIPSSLIPQTFRSLEIRLRGRSDVAAVSTGLRLRFNADTGANYDYQLNAGTGTSMTTAQFQAQTSLNCGTLTGNTALANLFSTHKIDIDGYYDAQNKTIRASASHKHNTTTGTMERDDIAGFWRNNAAITSISLFPTAGNFMAGTFMEMIAYPR